MPEGHTIHRAAQDQRPMLVDKYVSATSPQGRFADGAAAINGHLCTRIEALGKHLLYHFEDAGSLHIHLGLAGRIHRNPQPADPPRDVVRIRLETATHVVDITGPAICEILEQDALAQFRATYGPDLLADPEDPDRAIARIRKSRSPIATLLMNQKVIAGIGNIYRSEILWLQGLNPYTRGTDLSDAQLRALWGRMRDLMQIGVRYNSIITNGDVPKAGQDVSERVNIYGEDTCPTCQERIEVAKIAARTLYYCRRCQTE